MVTRKPAVPNEHQESLMRMPFGPEGLAASTVTLLWVLVHRVVADASAKRNAASALPYGGHYRAMVWGLGAAAAVSLALGTRPTWGQEPISGLKRDAGTSAPNAHRASSGLPEPSSLRGTVTRDILVRIAVGRSPALRATRLRAQARAMDGDAAARLPPPMAELQVWQVPITRPYAVDRAGMIMLGLKQDFPPASERRARAQAAQLDAKVDETMIDAQALALAAQVEHAFTDYQEATELVLIHQRHQSAAEGVARFAQALYAGGGSLSEIAQAEREVAMIEPELVMARQRVVIAKARLNGLLLRPTDAPLGPPAPWALDKPSEDPRRLVAKALAARPELRVARAKRVAALAEADAEASRAAIPMLSAGLYYFTPTQGMAEHGIGVSVSTTLPWLWGAPEASSRAALARADTASVEEEAMRAQIALEVASAAAEVEARASRLEAIERVALPASRRAEQATLAGYESSRTEALSFLMARTALVNTEVEAVAARAELEHAIIDLRWAVGRAEAPEKGNLR